MPFSPDLPSRRNFLFKALFLNALIGALSVTGTLAGPASSYIPGELLVRFEQTSGGTSRRHESDPALLDFLKESSALGITELVGPGDTRKPGVKRSPDQQFNGSFVKISFPPDADVHDLARKLMRLPYVRYAEPNYTGTLAYAPSDPLYPQQAGNHAATRIEQGWEAQLAQTGMAGSNAGVTVAVIDSGVDPTHPELAGALDLTKSYNFADGNAVVADDLGHGTRVAGIVGAVGNNSEGIAGIAFGCRLLSLDVVNSSGTISTDHVASAINFAAANGAQVLNMSFRFNANSKSLSEACTAAERAGCILIAPAGNENQGHRPTYPASYSTVVGVGALDLDGNRRAAFSNYNGTDTSLVELVAPGTGIFSTIPAMQYNGTYGSGTSFACPYVSGVAALLKTRYPDQSGPAIRSHLRATASPVTSQFAPAGGAGYGKLNAEQALVSPMLPDISVASVEIDDSPAVSLSNNGDATADEGETVQIVIQLTNTGADVSNLSGTLTVLAGPLNMLESDASWAPLQHGETARPLTTCTATIPALLNAANAILSLELSASSGTYHRITTFPLSLEKEEVILDGTNLFSPTVWTSDRTYVLEGQTNVFSGLTIEPGTIIRAKRAAKLEILGGSLAATGTEEKPILFKPYVEDTHPDIQDDDFLWARRHGGTGVEYARACTRSGATEALITGEFSNTLPIEMYDGSLRSLTATSASDPYLMKVDSDGKVLWADRIAHDGTEPACGTGIRTLSDGSFVCGGACAGNITFAPGTAGEISAPATVSDGTGRDAYLARYSSGGIPLWGRRIHRFDSSSSVFPWAIAGTSSDGAFICGEFRGSVVFSKGDAGETSMTAAGAGDMFLAKYDSTGTFLWARRAGGSSTVYPDPAKSVAFLSDGGCIVTGAFRATATFGAGEVPGPGQSGEVVLASAGANDIFVACYNSDGTLRWAKQAGSSGTAFSANDIGQAVNVLPDGSALVAGSFSRTAVFGPNDPAPISLTSAGSFDLFLAKYRADGTVAWAKRAGSTSSDQCYALDALPDGTASICGTFAAPLTFGPGEAGSTVLNPVGSVADVFVARFDGEGKFLWAKASGGHGDDIALGITMFDDESCVTVGAYDDDAVFGSGELRAVQFPQPDGYDSFMARYAGRFGWNGILISDSASSSSLANCILERGGLISESPEVTVQQCSFLRAPADGFRCTTGSLEVVKCHASGNRLVGFNVPSGFVRDSTASSNRSSGMTCTTATRVEVASNAGAGVICTEVTASTATQNLGNGFVSAGPVSSCVSRDNTSHGIICSMGDVTGCSSEGNQGSGIVISGGGSAINCQLLYNGQNGITTDGSSVTDCQILGSGAVGVAGSGASILANCRISKSTAAAATGLQRVDNVSITENASGIGSVTDVVRAYVGNNNSTGVEGGTIVNSAIVGNTGAGVLAPTSISNSWIVGNKGAGIDGASTGTATFCTVTQNNGGIVNLGPGGATNCNITGNLGYDARDTQTRSGFQTKDFGRNWWGTSVTAWMLANDWPQDRDPEIQDGFDSAQGWFLDYSLPSSAPVANAPDVLAPACLLSATPPHSGEEVTVGPQVFSLVFSRDMDVSRSPAVTFGQKAPYDAHVVVESPGWIDARTWQGTFAIQSDTGEGTNTLRVSNAVDATGFVIPDDTRHQFVISSGKPAANNGLVTGTSTNAIMFEWSENDKPADTLGYHITRVQLDSEGKAISDPALLTTSGVWTSNTYTDTTVAANQVYQYVVNLVQSGMESIQWIPPLTATASCPPEGCPSAVDDWMMY